MNRIQTFIISETSQGSGDATFIEPSREVYIYRETSSSTLPRAKRIEPSS